MIGHGIYRCGDCGSQQNAPLDTEATTAIVPRCHGKPMELVGIATYGHDAASCRLPEEKP